MNRSKYWDLNTFQKAELSAAEIEAFRRVELMIQGVEIPREPEIPIAAPSFSEFVKKCTSDGQPVGVPVKTVKLGFDTYVIEPDQVEAWLSLSVKKLRSAYVNNENIAIDADPIAIEVSEVMTYPNFTSLKRDYEALHGDANRRKKEWERYNDAVAAAAKATQSMITDWEDAQDAVRIYNRIESTYQEFCELAEDANKAAVFLHKQCSYEDMETYQSLRQELGLSRLPSELIGAA